MYNVKLWRLSLNHLYLENATILSFCIVVDLLVAVNNKNR